MSDTLDRVREIVIAQLDIPPGPAADAVTAESVLIDDLGADSLDGVEIVMALEEDFDLEIQDSEAENCLKVGDLATLIDQKLAG